ncbi:putative bifunctional diguanylate cyclase/phosphodiesterase [Ornithinibacillus contaminans]|uniref:putative bifunctional diguanylate cyclase/phosphodiesterase n=1 Tax=Ornithinibacillus contaminans TaxID=694055 RepID=UPI0006A7A235|nr:bifunctional diguanylate cyclase/phosphodiesterase [Ornithinibacillus contaminans]
MGEQFRLKKVEKDRSFHKVIANYETRLQYVESHDGLTNLANRSSFERKIIELIHINQPFALLRLDLDRLRIINESLGQSIGDQMIREFSHRIKLMLKDDAFFARISGNEFGILLWNVSPSVIAEKVACDIIESCKAPIVQDGYELFVTTSIGISIFDADGKTVDEIIRNAEVALFEAKERGNNHYLFYASTLCVMSVKELELEKDLRKSIANEQLVVHFQPRVDAVTGKIASAEALIRWMHPVRGLISPNEFIPLAEEIGFITEIGDWVIRQIGIYMKQWKDTGIELVPISINLSAQRFLKEDWKSTILEILTENEIDPSLIEFEITETTLIKYEKEVEEALNYLRDLGIRIALDDFGTGYSSLTYLYKFPIDTIKIDRSFIHQVTEKAEAAIIITSLISMVKGLGMNLVAEGVETKEQLAFLKQQKCHEIQGYVFSKPVPEQDFRSLLLTGILTPHNHVTTNTLD